MLPRRTVSYLRQNWILIDSYDYKGQVLSARECRLRLGIHFCFPFAVSVLISKRYGGSALATIAWAVFWWVLVTIKEYRESKWQLPVKTRSDVLSKLLGLIGLFV